MKSKIAIFFNECKNTAWSILFTLMIRGYPVFAANSEDSGGGGGVFTVKRLVIPHLTNPSEAAKRLLGVLARVVEYVGAPVLIWGVVMFAMALKDDRPEDKQKAIMTIVTGTVLFSLFAILRAAGITT